MKKNKSQTFPKLYEVKNTSSLKVVNVDRLILQRLVITYKGVRLGNQPERNLEARAYLSASLAEMNGSLRTGQKFLLMEELCKNHPSVSE